MKKGTLLFVAFAALALTQCKKEEDLTEKVVGTYSNAVDESIVVRKLSNQTIHIEFQTCCSGTYRTASAKMDTKETFTLDKSTVVDTTGYRSESIGNGLLSEKKLSIAMYHYTYLQVNDSLVWSGEELFGGTKQ